MKDKELFYQHKREVQAFIDHYELNDKRLLLAISGGLDSVYLFYLLHALDLSITFAHINYQLRGEDAFMDAQFVKDLAATHNIPLHLKEVDMPSLLSEGGNMQSLARKIRYEYFETLSENHDFDAIFTAHHLNDQVETVLWNLINGAGSKGLRGILEKNNNKYRPLLHFSKEEIERSMKAQDWQWREDLSNQENDYKRNFIRNKVMPLLEELNPSVLHRVAHTSRLMRESELMSVQFFEQWKSNHLLKVDASHWKFSKTSILSSQAAYTIIYELLNFFKLSQQYVNAFYEMLYSQSGALLDLGNYILWSDRENLILEKKLKDTASLEKSLMIEAFEGKRKYEFQNELYEFNILPNKKEILKNCIENKVSFLNADIIEWPLELRNWRAGDTFQPYGMKGEKKVAKYFKDIKLPVFEKDKQVLLEDKKSILGILGLRMSARTHVSADCHKIMTIVKVKKN